MLRDVPYAHDKRRSVVARMSRGGIRPKGIGGLLSWFLTEWAQEIPDRIHTRGVFFGRPERIELRTLGGSHSSSKDLTGGSVLGAPADAQPFRRYIEERATQRNEDGDYTKPVHAALGAMQGRATRVIREGREVTADGAYMALFLGAVAASGGDWEGVAYRSGIPSQVGRVYLECALNRLWDLWRPAPLPVEETKG